MANETLHISPAGLRALREREGVARSYFIDEAGNCSHGYGALAHYGPCTTEELQRPVDTGEAEARLESRIEEAERRVRSIVREFQLSQEQFDAAVSFACQASADELHTTFAPANRGDLAAVARRIMRSVYIRPRDGSGRPVGPPRISRSLVLRRRQERRPFRTS